MGTRIALHVRDVGGLGICIWEDQFFVFVPKIAGNEPQYSVGRIIVYGIYLSDFLCLPESSVSGCGDKHWLMASCA